MNKIPMVVILGRTNVGKSTLFNRLSADSKSITLDQEGVTRDAIKDTVCWNERCFTLVDTGGISVRKLNDPIAEKVRKRVLAMIDDANLILFVCDGAAGLIPEDRELAQVARKTGKPVFLIVNKADRKDAQEKNDEFEALGFTPAYFLSAQHGIGIADLLEDIANALPIVRLPEDNERICKIVLLGKPNVGKSSLLNLLLNQERAIVHDMPGTTREAITERVTFYQEDIQVTDTAGVRRKKSVDDTLESLMVKSSFDAVRGADIVLLLIDGSQGVMADQELKLAFYALENYKALIILFNKEDLADEQTKASLDFSLEEYPHMTSKVPQLTISCKSGKNIGKILPMVTEVWKRYCQRFSDEKLTRLFKDALVARPLYHKTFLLTLFRVQQVKTAPTTLALTVNVPEWFGTSQLSFFENLMRQNFDLEGVPVEFVLRKK